MSVERVGKQLPGAGSAMTTQELLDADRIEDSVEEATEAFQRSVTRILNWPDVQDPAGLLKRSVEEYSQILAGIQEGKTMAKRDAGGIDVTKASLEELQKAFEADPGAEAAYLAAAREGRLEQPVVKSEPGAAPSPVLEAFEKAAQEAFPTLAPTEALETYLESNPRAEELLAEAMRRGL